MNAKNRNRSLTQHRKVAVSFRDVSLFKVFEISLSVLNSLATRALDFASLGNVEQALRFEDQLLDQALQLLEKCLTFDFIGVLPDESTDDASTLQVPASWRDRIQTGSTLRLLFNLYKGCTTGKIPIFVDASAPVIIPGAAGAAAGGGGGGGGGAAGAGGFGSSPSAFGSVVGGGGGGAMRDFTLSEARAAQTLDCLTLMISVRRSLFAGDAERKRFLTHTMRGVCDILREKQGLRDQDCFHRFCRLLSRIKNNQQLNELIRAEGYSEWLSMTAAFTVEACARPTWTANAMAYLLRLWANLVNAVPYARVEQAQAGGAGGAAAPPDVQLDRYLPDIISAFVRGKVDQIQSGEDREAAFDELSELENIEDQLENLPVLCRYLYSYTAPIVSSLIENLAGQYQRALQAVHPNLEQLAAMPGGGESHDVVIALRTIECQLGWMASTAVSPSTSLPQLTLALAPTVATPTLPLPRTGGHHRQHHRRRRRSLVLELERTHGRDAARVGPPAGHRRRHPAAGARGDLRRDAVQAGLHAHAAGQPVAGHGVLTAPERGRGRAGPARQARAR